MTFTAELLSWYRVHHRDLPWRHTRDPYLIWISEVIFQQTRIRQGLEYYNRFTGRFPDVNTLAGASEEEVLKLWQGLGYYTRARNLHASAIYIARERGGRFPDSYKEILKLKGVGDYTAAAIASIAFRIPEPVVDGNVMRFVSRYAGITAAVDSPEGKQAIRHFAAQRIDREDPGTYNQAMMEFGALHCLQKNPLCDHCPFVRECFAFRQGKISDLPLKKKKASLKDRYFHYFVIGDGEMFWLNKRTGKDIWKNLYEFPLIETASPVSPEEILLSDAWKNLSGDGIFENTGRISKSTHLLTHQRIHLVFYHFFTLSKPSPPAVRASGEDLSIYPVPKPVEKIFSYLCTTNKEFKLKMDDGPAKYQTLKLKP